MTFKQSRDKFLSLHEAVKRYIKKGDQIAIGGFTVNRNPMALVYEIVRQGIEDLHIVCHSGGQALDILIGAGCVKALEIAYSGNGRFAPTCIRFKKAIERGEIVFEDYSNYHMALRFLAGSLGIPFIPAKTGLGSDILNMAGFPEELRRKKGISPRKLDVIQNPFSEDMDPVLLLPALTPDCAIIHSQYAGDGGTIRIKGLTFADIEQAKSAGKVIVTCEKILPESEIREDPDQNALPPFLVDAIVEVPYGAHPTACYGFYDYDPDHLSLYRKAAEDDELFRNYLNEWVYSLASHGDYLKKVGEVNLERIKTDMKAGYTRNLKRA